MSTETTNSIPLFSPITIKSVTFRNRIGVSPMCQYSSVDGFPSDWHLVHLGSRAVGGAALVIAEATAVEPRGRISNGCTGIWKDDHIEPWSRIAKFIKEHGSVPGIQIAHAGRKASASRPWEGDASLSNEDGGWDTVAPSALAFGGALTKVPIELSVEEIGKIKQAFVDATKRAEKAGFEFLEIHAAHGYLFNSFYSPLSNKRTDQYGGSFENRTRFLTETIEAIRKEWPDKYPLSVRMSCSEWEEGGWTINDTVEISKVFKKLGVDIVDCSGGFNTPNYKLIPFGPGYQIPFGEVIKKEVGIVTAGVGLITEPEQANQYVAENKVDMVLLASRELDDPYWPYHAAVALGLQTPYNLLPTTMGFWLKRFRGTPAYKSTL